MHKSGSQIVVAVDVGVCVRVVMVIVQMIVGMMVIAFDAGRVCLAAMVKHRQK
jgi:hypothetical protein